MTSVAFTVQTKPVSTNRTYKRGAGRRLYKSDEAVAFFALLQLGARQAMRGRPPLTGYVQAELCFVFDSNRPDIDGSIKPVLDSMQRIVYRNDRQVRRLIVDYAVDREHPRVGIVVTEITP